MKGVVFNIVEEFVTEGWSVDDWDDLLDEAGLDGAYTTLGTYPDAQLGALVEAAAARSASRSTRCCGRPAVTPSVA